MILGDWFAVLPGSSPAAQCAAAALHRLEPGARTLAYHAGTPWIVGCQSRSVTVAQNAGTTAVLLGAHTVTEEQLLRAMPSGVNGPTELLRFPGSYTAVVARGQDITAYGDVAGMRPLFTAEVGGAWMLADRALLLADLTGTARVDRQNLALCLLGPVPPLPLAESGTSPYEGVQAVPPGSSVHIAGTAIRMRRWWTPPDDERPLHEAAPVLRDALAQAVAVRTAGPAPVACELSGGADSTALSALAYERIGARVINLTRAPADPGNDDVTWARRVIVDQPGARHEIVPVAAIPPQFAGIDNPPALDAPSPSALSPDRSAQWWTLAASSGARVMLSGKGGDETTLTPVTYLHRLGRLERRRHVTGWAALWGLPRRQVLTLAGNTGTYTAWLAHCLTRRSEAHGWEASPSVPPWMSAGARERLADALGQVRDAEPLHERSHQHTTAAAVRGLARWSRHQTAAAEPFGIHMEYPYADRHVIEAAMATRAQDRTSPYQNKPLLSAAMSGIVAPDIRARRTKGGYSADTEGATTGARRKLAQLLCEGSQLASLELIDPGRLAAAVADWKHADGSTDLLLHLTLMCEVWARTVHDTTPTTTTEAR
ncbi:asparagine synthase-related protein [Streptomyces sp. NPDC059193]|uniref:asparagine synthase-related protein n=1 Tax=Streptomyces sp. NPDC059193 TaxID=3346763 RepID=UPI0036CCDBC0